MERFLGAKIDLGSKVRTHLFLLCPNNSGSTFLMKAIGKSRRVWSLVREGQHIIGFSGPQTRGSDVSLVWGAYQHSLDLYSSPHSYPNWVKTRQAWYFQASASSPDASVFATKSPPFLLIPQELEKNFRNAKFLLMVRNPYAMLEGIVRRRINLNESRRYILLEAARHIVQCFKIQQINVKRYQETGEFFTYEEMCQSPVEVALKIQNLVPELVDLNLSQKLSIKGRYYSNLHNFNGEQIDRLSVDDLCCVNEVFEQEAALFADFGYSLITGFNSK